VLAFAERADGLELTERVEAVASVVPAAFDHLDVDWSGVAARRAGRSGSSARTSPSSQGDASDSKYNGGDPLAAALREEALSRAALPGLGQSSRGEYCVRALRPPSAQLG
jgi:hypothetical protein